MSTIKADIHNGPDGGFTRKYVICSVVDGELWYYGEDNDLTRVKKICRDQLVNKCYFEVDYHD